MATTVFFEEAIKDKGNKSVEMTLEFGRSSFSGETLMYLAVDGKSLAVDSATALRIFDAINSLGTSLGYDKPGHRGDPAILPDEPDG